MITNNLIKDHAIVLCGHGSRNISYMNDLLILKTKIESKINFSNIFDCYIEINKPSVNECLKNLDKKFEKIFIFPLLLFDGKHFLEDIKQQINKLSFQTKKKIVLLEKISLLDEICPIVKKIIRKKEIGQKKFNFLITSCSLSKQKEVIKMLRDYTLKLSKTLDIEKNNFHFVGDEKNAFEQIKKVGLIPANIILHPMFFFNGFLFKKSITTFSKYPSVTCLDPLFSYDEIVNILKDKLVTRI